MQTLNVKAKDPATGREVNKTVRVVRSWQSSMGQLFLFADGSYGFKNGSPARHIEDLGIIADPNQYNAALRWWKMKGEKASRAFYEAQNKRLAARASDYSEKAEFAEADLDAATYYRSLRGGSGEDEGPGVWSEYFTSRPDWWGACDEISFKEYRYRRSDLEVEGADAAIDAAVATADDLGGNSEAPDTLEDF